MDRILRTPEYQENNSEPQYDLQGSIKALLADDDIKLYGNRCLKAYTKLDLLGKGGCAVVWLCQDSQGNKVAVKQFPKTSKNDTNYKSGLQEIKT